MNDLGTKGAIFSKRAQEYNDGHKTWWWTVSIEPVSVCTLQRAINRSHRKISIKFYIKFLFATFIFTITHVLLFYQNKKDWIVVCWI